MGQELNGSPGSPLQPEAGMREAGEREDRDAETLCHGELPLLCSPCLPWVLSSGCWAPLRHSPKGATALPCADLGAGEMGGRKELITISSSAGFFFLLLSCCSVLLEPGNPAIGFVFFFFYLFLSGLVRELPTPPPLSP